MDVIIDKIHQLTPTIRAFELIATDSTALTPFSAGSHVDVFLKNGLTRQYSLSNCCSEQHRYVIAVLHDANSRGGSACMHEQYHEGDILSIGQPRNLFEIHPETESAVLFAGGIGITPILAMAYHFKRNNISFELHYFVRSREQIAFYGNLTAHFADQIYFHINEEPESKANMAEILAQRADTRHLYVCGPNGFMDFVIQSARQTEWQNAQIHQEHFIAEKIDTSGDQAFTIEIKGYDTPIEVPAHQTVATALITHGFDIPLSCEQGICGTCILNVIEGIPEHRDLFMTDAEHAANTQFTPCCSRAKTAKLVIEL
ncbi:oxidoreductase [Acinetobacter qingfengensis]|uniref:Vanillate O-demethylase oxidoreductase n=1 Tax=Acinetobacter qingfengensis TaxID=1262585 RepID=A0A1E7QWS6_9GAMM|nr:PDR/VanB family oxidoreductase [Acinetobacter qingfengensis]KAA8731252.1 oxidoreductase [Acinetobacter qingfengensis]OEY91501.1 Vanillate O-demethylase oxidoreductase [Acinetobacter qingfengensis]